MQILRKFFCDTTKYHGYAVTKAKTDLKTEVANSYLGCLWWFLDPLFFMLVYAFVSVVVFKASEPYFAAFIFIGCTTFKLFDRTIKTSTKLISSNRTIIKNIYIPKTVMLLSSLYLNCFVSFISFTLVFISMYFYGVPLTYHCWQFVPLAALLVSLCYGMGMIFMHCGVFVEDLYNVINIALTLMMYVSGVFFSIPNRITNEVLRTCMLDLNPIAFIIEQMRAALLYGGNLDVNVYLIWLVISVVVNVLGIWLVYRHENAYVKMMQ